VGTGKGASGLPDTLAALAEHRVDTLLVSQGYGVDGWRCGSCKLLAAKGRACSSCGAEMHAVSDVVEEAVETALMQSCRVEICVDNADLDVAGRIGALLRY
jgi:peptide subunit release factor 1 (eRF1)